MLVKILCDDRFDQDLPYDLIGETVSSPGECSGECGKCDLNEYCNDFFREV